MKKIHVGFLLSYDYEKLKISIPPVYHDSDAIFIAIDKDFRTWTGQKFIVDELFFEWLKEIDVDNKIIIYEDDFYVEGLTSIQNDTRERYLLSLKMGIGNWLVQVDSDEYFLDFKKFTETLRKYDCFLINPKKNPVQIAGYLINIYKYLEEGLLYVEQPTKVMLATNYPNYKRARNTKERIIYTNNILLHECLSRSEEELVFKFSNWGHRDELNPSFFDKWKSATKDNYNELKNVFYLDPTIWKSLGYLPVKNLNSIMLFINKENKLKVSKKKLLSKNFGQWFKHLKIFKFNNNSSFVNYLK